MIEWGLINQWFLQHFFWAHMHGSTSSNCLFPGTGNSIANKNINVLRPLDVVVLLLSLSFVPHVQN